MRNLFIGLASALALTTGAVTPILTNSNIIQKLAVDVDTDAANEAHAKMLAAVTKTITSYQEYSKQFDLKAKNAKEASDKIAVPYPDPMPNDEVLTPAVTLTLEKLSYMIEVGTTLHKYITESIQFYLPKNIKSTAPQILETNDKLKGIISNVGTVAKIADKFSVLYFQSNIIKNAQTRISNNFASIIAKSENIKAWLKGEIENLDPKL